jgi:hypothetical protein
MAEAECTLTIATYTEFSGELRPERVAAGEPARVLVENRGNIQQAFTLTCQSPDEALIFEPAPSQELRVPPGEVSTAEFSAKPRSRPFYGGEVTFPFTTRVQSSGLETQNLRGQVVIRALIPTWVLPVALVLIMVLACCWAVVLFSGGSPEAAPTTPPEATEVPTVEVPPEQPTEPPPEIPTEVPPEQPTEPPPEVPTEVPPEQPTEPPPEVPTEVPPEQPPTEPPPEGGLPCTPLVFGLILAPLLVIGKKGRRSMDPG